MREGGKKKVNKGRREIKTKQKLNRRGKNEGI